MRWPPPDLTPGDNSPAIGPLDVDKERRWAADRERCWQRFTAAAETIMRLPTKDERAAALISYSDTYGPHAAASLRSWI
jgi:hypothetical protein